MVVCRKRFYDKDTIRKATVWETPRLKQLDIVKILHSLGVELISPTADKREMIQCDLGITEADYLLPETGTLVLKSSFEQPALSHCFHVFI